MLSNIYVKIGVYAAVLVAGFYLGFRFESGRYAAYRAQVLAAAEKQAAQSAEKEKEWQRKYTEALEINAQNQKWISDHNKPVPRVVCHYAGSSPLPETSATPAAGTPAAGDVPPEPGRDFDPTDKLTALADQADQVVEACRVMLNSWPQ